MTRLLLAAVAAAVLATGGLHPRLAAADDKPAKAAQKPAKAKKAAGPLIGHMVYFTLKERTPADRERLVAACKKYLAEHDGVVFFSAGVITEDFKRDVNDRDWDVALHLVFADKAAHDKYQDHPRHLKFIEENKDSWAKVRVFDSELADVAAGRKGKAGAAAPAGGKPDEALRQLQEEVKRLRDEQEAVRQQLEKRLQELKKKDGK